MTDLDPIFGDPALAPRIALHDVKGNLFAARPRYVLERWGDAGLRDVLERVGDSARRALKDTIFPFSWYPLPLMAEVDRAIVEGPMGGHVALMKEFGATIARYDLSTVYKVLFKVGTPAFVMRRMNVAYRTYIRGGAVQSETPSSSNATVRLIEGTFPKYFCTYGVAGWITAAIELSGGQRVKASEVSCVHNGAKHCVWQAQWS